MPRDPAEAVRWYRKAAEQGSDVGQYELGLITRPGSACPRSGRRPWPGTARPRRRVTRAPRTRSARAYENGPRGRRTSVLAADWYRKAADQNLPIAEYNLGRLYLGGRGVFKDTAKGQALLQKAADAGEPNAMVYVAEMYEKGDGKPRDPDQATRLYRDALARPGITARNRDTATRALAAARCRQVASVALGQRRAT